MSQVIYSQIVLISIFAISIIQCSSAPPPTEPESLATPPFSKIFAFGDSFTDTGNTNSSTGPSIFHYVSNPPYGITYFNQPTNRYSDGRLIIDFVCQYLNHSFLPPFLDEKADTSQGVNFAVAGGTAIEYDYFQKKHMLLDIIPESIGTELTWFSDYLEQQGGCSGNLTECLNDALFWVGEIGVNDYAYSVIFPNVSKDEIQTLAVERLNSFLEGILEKGAKYVVVQGLPPAGCLPLSMKYLPNGDKDEYGCVGSLNQQILNHNLAIQAKLEDLRTKVPNSVILYADYWKAYQSVLKDPAAYGFVEVFNTCCGAGGQYNFKATAACGSHLASKACGIPSEYINWDGVHLTEAMYKVVFDMFAHGDYTEPSFDYLLDRKRRES